MLNASYKMAASVSDKRMPITTPPYKVTSVDVTPDPPTFSLDTTFKALVSAPRTNYSRCFQRYYLKLCSSPSSLQMNVYGTYSVVDPHHLDADTDPNSTYHPHA